MGLGKRPARRAAVETYWTLASFDAAEPAHAARDELQTAQIAARVFTSPWSTRPVHLLQVRRIDTEALEETIQRVSLALSDDGPAAQVIQGLEGDWPEVIVWAGSFEQAEDIAVELIGLGIRSSEIDFDAGRVRLGVRWEQAEAARRVIYGVDADDPPDWRTPYADGSDIHGVTSGDLDRWEALLSRSTLGPDPDAAGPLCADRRDRLPRRTPRQDPGVLDRRLVVGASGARPHILIHRCSFEEARALHESQAFAKAGLHAWLEAQPARDLAWVHAAIPHVDAALEILARRACD